MRTMLNVGIHSISLMQPADWKIAAAAEEAIREAIVAVRGVRRAMAPATTDFPVLKTKPESSERFERKATRTDETTDQGSGCGESASARRQQLCRIPTVHRLPRGYLVSDQNGAADRSALESDTIGEGPKSAPLAEHAWAAENTNTRHTDPEPKGRRIRGAMLRKKNKIRSRETSTTKSLSPGLRHKQFSVFYPDALSDNAT